MTAAFVILISACASNPPEHQASTLRPGVNAQGVQHTEMVVGSYWFRPEHMVVKRDVPVIISIRREPGIVPHSFVINEPEAGMVVSLALTTGPQEVRFTPTQTGTFPFSSDKTGLFGSHRNRGMEGVVQVED